MMDRNLALRGGSANTPSTVCFHPRRMLVGPKVSGCSHGLVGRGNDISGGVDQAAAGWFGERDDLVGRDLTWRHSSHSLKPGFPLFDGDLGFALGSHGDHPGWSSQTRVIGSDLAGDVGQLDGSNHAAVLAQPVWLATVAAMAARSSLAASTSAGSVRLAGVVSSAQRRAERLQAS
jgi:hypothetical protein